MYACSLGNKATLSCEVIHASMPMKLGGNWMCSLVLCPATRTLSAGIKCQHYIYMYIIYILLLMFYLTIMWEKYKLDLDCPAWIEIENRNSLLSSVYMV